jgi:Translation initiation factor 1 (eIF-1/SUI1) and related proteins
MCAKRKILSGNGWSFEPVGAKKAAKETESLPAEKQHVKIVVEKRAKGKIVTALTGFVLSTVDRKALTKSLKNACGSGGSDSEDSIEIQGDHREAVSTRLQDLGWRVK